MGFVTWVKRLFITEFAAEAAPTPPACCQLMSSSPSFHFHPGSVCPTRRSSRARNRLIFLYLSCWRNTFKQVHSPHGARACFPLGLFGEASALGRRSCQMVNNRHFSHRRHCQYLSGCTHLWQHADGPRGAEEEVQVGGGGLRGEVETEILRNLLAETRKKIQSHTPRNLISATNTVLTAGVSRSLTEGSSFQ